MTIGVNDPKIEAQAEELSGLNGKPVDQAVAELIAAEVVRLNREVEIAERVQRVLKIAAEMREALGPEGLERLKNMDDELYDEDGLPHQTGCGNFQYTDIETITVINGVVKVNSPK